eukprot:PhF_6_TR29252/c0_g1_i2/m.42821
MYTESDYFYRSQYTAVPIRSNANQETICDLSKPVPRLGNHPSPVRRVTSAPTANPRTPSHSPSPIHRHPPVVRAGSTEPVVVQAVRRPSPREEDRLSRMENQLSNWAAEVQDLKRLLMSQMGSTEHPQQQPTSDSNPEPSWPSSAPKRPGSAQYTQPPPHVNITPSTHSPSPPTIIQPNAINYTLTPTESALARHSLTALEGAHNGWASRVDMFLAHLGDLHYAYNDIIHEQRIQIGMLQDVARRQSRTAGELKLDVMRMVTLGKTPSQISQRVQKAADDIKLMTHGGAGGSGTTSEQFSPSPVRQSLVEGSL